MDANTCALVVQDGVGTRDGVADSAGARDDRRWCAHHLYLHSSQQATWWNFHYLIFSIVPLGKNCYKIKILN